MSTTDELDRSLLHLRLESFVTARYGISGTLRSRLCAEKGTAALSHAARELADVVWVVFSDDRTPHAVGMRQRRTATLAARYEVFESSNGDLKRSVWRFREAGWERLQER
jgi:hypothetical protein